MDDPFNCPDCGSHDYGLYAAGCLPCPHCQAKRISELTAEIATLRVDAERYRWLREKHLSNDWGSGSITFHWSAPMGGGGSLDKTLHLYRDSLDAAIDEARKLT